MPAKKDCFGSETYVCMTQACPLVSDCVKVVWEKKLRRLMARTPAAKKPGALLSTSPSGVRMRSREFTPSAGRYLP